MRGLRSVGALAFSLGFLAVLAYAAYEINTGFSTQARLFGNTFIFPAIGLGVAQVVRELRRAQPPPVPPEAAFTRSALAWAAVFFAMVWAVGLAITIPLFAVCYLRLAAGEAWPKAGAYAAIAWLSIELLFIRLLHVPLPGGAIPLPGITT